MSPEIIAREIVEDLQAALLEFEAVAVALEARAAERAARQQREDTPDCCQTRQVATATAAGVAPCQEEVICHDDIGRART